MKKIEKENATFQQVLALKTNRTKRTQMGKFFVEGVQGIKDAISNGWEISAVFFTELSKLSNWTKDLVSSLKCEKYEISNELMEKLSQKTDTSELVATFKMKELEFEPKSKQPLILLIDRPSKKENLGNIIRSADAFNVDLILFTGHSVDIFDPVVIRTSMGSFFKVPFKHMASNNEIDEFVKSMRDKHKDFQIVATSLQAEDDIHSIDFKLPTLLLVGNEREGLNNHLNSICDKKAKIAMGGNLDSLNIASATAIFLFTAYYSKIKP